MINDNFLLTPYDTGAGYGRLSNKNPVVGTTQGGTRPMRDQYGTDYTVDIEEEEDKEIDDFVDDIDYIMSLKIGNRTDSISLPVKDLGNRIDRSRMVGNNAILEEDYPVHTTTARKGISPFPHKKMSGGPIGTGGADQAFKTTGNFKRTGTQYGTSRSHKLLTNIEDNNIFDLSGILDKMERSFLRQQSRIKKLLSTVNNISS